MATEVNTADISAIISRTWNDQDKLEHFYNILDITHNIGLLEKSLGQDWGTMATFEETAKVKNRLITRHFRYFSTPQKILIESLFVMVVLVHYANDTTHQDTPLTLFHKVMGEAYAQLEKALMDHLGDENNGLWADPNTFNKILSLYQTQINSDNFNVVFGYASQGRTDPFALKLLREWVNKFIENLKF